MRISQSYLVAALLSSAFAAPQVQGQSTVVPQSLPSPKAISPPRPAPPVASPRSTAPSGPVPSQAPPAQPPRPNYTPRPAPPAGPSTLCGGNRPACPSGQYCYDANQDRVVGTTDANAVGTCFGSVCNLSTTCPVGQVCGAGTCQNANLDCGFLGDECPEEPGWRCIGGVGPFARGYCGYSARFSSF